MTVRHGVVECAKRLMTREPPLRLAGRPAGDSHASSPGRATRDRCAAVRRTRRQLRRVLVFGRARRCEMCGIDPSFG